MKTCLNCVNWDFEGCPLKQEYTTQYDTCDQHELETVFIWGVFYSYEEKDDIIYDSYKTQEEAEEHVARLIKQGARKVYTKNIYRQEDAN